jgi:hypothetical protein
MIGVNPIMVKNDVIVTLHLDDEECGSEQLAPYSKLHGDDTLASIRLPPHCSVLGWSSRAHRPPFQAS